MSIRTMLDYVPGASDEFRADLSAALATASGDSE
jgi:hypothetical protein